MSVRTVGVEEELFLVDPETRLIVPGSQRVLKHAAEHEPQVGPEDLGHELYLHQVETRTPPLESMTDLRAELVRTRRLAAEAAEATGLVTMAAGTVPTVNADPHVTHDDRYLDMVARFGEIARPGGTCGMHVHVFVESPEVGVSVIDQLVPWLPVVLAISANSPYLQGHDTAYASWRSQAWSQWPSAGPTEAFGSLEAYREVSAQMLASGAARDDGMLYFDARLAAEHPTVEVRISDVCTDPDDAVLIAAALRGLVTRAVRRATGEADEERTAAGRSAEYVWRSELLRAAQWRAARHALTGQLLDPATGELAPAAAVLDRLLAVTREALEETGDVELVQDGLRRALAGGGASRQRAAFERTGEVAGVVDDVVDRTNAVWRG
ncbi:glutamate--cysteine ligase [Phycicoccus endophyticus]|uniref:Putative glutamate--cysteine ligase 2 n=1 Tax=Phycicoccus endophyticus TaxID=1690220 RepID=A0A7G9R1E6_9MICO|nr:glutamate--cysteine ligase [Phycicoccus endophyticus]NHI18793.1 YbdK family carboxylate-amine ligase [Phycicoccus endophyticus]QNN49421.1 glutamate--cysteine ligase [Phycicoccus endophyticus]GGL36521.1 putative glutamate--cysteine ligase 2 [Phycicoccus endophyticus]